MIVHVHDRIRNIIALVLNGMLIYLRSLLEIHDVMHSSVIWALYMFGQTPSLHVCERELGMRLDGLVVKLCDFQMCAPVPGPIFPTFFHCQ